MVDTDEDSAAPDAPDSGDQGGDSTPCAPAGLRDDFSAPTLDAARWRTIGFMGWTPELVDGRLSFTPKSGYANTRSGMVRSLASFDLTGCSTWLEVPRTLPAEIRGEMTVVLTAASGDDVGLFRVRQGSLYMMAGNAEQTPIPFDPVAHRWWRFREAADVVYLETSPDARTWTVRHQEARSADVSAVRLSITVIETSINAMFEAPQFDNVNIVP